jgi:hypothetical protein
MKTFSEKRLLFGSSKVVRCNNSDLLVITD